MNNLDVSIIIPTLNSAETIIDCLQSIRANITKYRYEIIVIDARSTDKTCIIAEHYADHILKGVPARINRNLGIEHARGSILCFTDSDCVVPTNWIEALVNGLIELNEQDDQVVGVGGGNVPFLKNPTIQEQAIAQVMRSPLVSFKSRNTANYKKQMIVSHNPPINSCCYKRVIEEVGGYKEENGYPEDLDLDARITAKGYKLLYIPNVIVLHKHKTNINQFAIQMRDFGRKRIRINQRYKEIRRIFHYGPMVLCLMLYSPLVFFPFLLAFVNAMFVYTKTYNYRIILYTIYLTICFYRNYGLGEMEAIRKG